MVEKNELSGIHKKLLVLLNDFDRICRENQICYSLHGGSLLGAVRNQKLIPWDDDIDISMTRSNYEKFKAVCKKSEGENHLNEIDSWVSRFVNRKDKDNLSVDILIWDYISEKKIAQLLKIYFLRFLQGTLKRSVNYKDYSKKNRILLRISHMIGIFMSRKFKLKRYRSFSEKRFTGTKKFIHKSNDSFKGVGEIYDSEYMSEYDEIELEGRLYMVNVRCRESLEVSYGKNYLTPPPESERKPSHEGLREHFLND